MFCWLKGPKIYKTCRWWHIFINYERQRYLSSNPDYDWSFSCKNVARVRTKIIKIKTFSHPVQGRVSCLSWQTCGREIESVVSAVLHSRNEKRNNFCQWLGLCAVNMSLLMDRPQPLFGYFCQCLICSLCCKRVSFYGPTSDSFCSFLFEPRANHLGSFSYTICHWIVKLTKKERGRGWPFLQKMKVLLKTLNEFALSSRLYR